MSSIFQRRDPETYRFFGTLGYMSVMEICLAWMRPWIQVLVWQRDITLPPLFLDLQTQHTQCNSRSSEDQQVFRKESKRLDFNNILSFLMWDQLQYQPESQHITGGISQPLWHIPVTINRNRDRSTITSRLAWAA